MERRILFPVIAILVASLIWWQSKSEGEDSNPKIIVAGSNDNTKPTSGKSEELQRPKLSPEELSELKKASKLNSSVTKELSESEIKRVKQLVFVLRYEFNGPIDAIQDNIKDAQKKLIKIDAEYFKCRYDQIV